MAGKQTFYVHYNGHSWYVKTREFFEQQGGFEEEWGKAWSPILATSIEDARTKAEEAANA